MKARVLFGLIGFAFVLLSIFRFPPVILETLMLPLCALATYEFIGSTGLVRNRMMVGISLLVSVVFAAGTAYVWQPIFMQLLVVLAAILGLVCLLRHHAQMRVEEVASALFGALLLPYLLLAMIRIFHMQNGAFLLLLPMLAAWGSDTFALFSGMLFGKHKLAPVISPKKTIEGAVGGVFGGILFVLVYTMIMVHSADVCLPYGVAVLVGAIGSVIGQIGDLSFSIIKRQTGIKDYGSIFPGHGGVLDRFDSVIFVAPVIELTLRIFAA